MTETAPTGARPQAAETAAKAPAPPLPTRITDYLTSATARPKAFLSGLAAAGIERLEREDEEQVLAVLVEQPALTRRLAELVHTAAKARHSRKLQKVADAIVRVGGRAARCLAQRAFALGGEELIELQPMTMALAEKVSCAGSAGAIEGLEPFDLFKLWIWHALARGLGLDDAVEAAQKISDGRRTKGAAGQEPDKEVVIELLFAPPTRPSQLPKLLALTAPALSLAQERAAEIDRLQARCALLERRLADAVAKWEALQQHASEQAAALASAERRIEELDRNLLDERAAHGHRQRNARGGFTKFLAKEIGPRLENALEAVTAKPPYLDVTEDRLRFISSLIEAQIRKLQETTE
jgi:hypothetical protein